MPDYSGKSESQQSFLATRHKEFLAGEYPDISDGYESKMHTEIKQRTVNAIEEFRRLTGLPDSRKQAVFESLGRENIHSEEDRIKSDRVGGGTDEHLPAQLARLFRFIYEGTGGDVSVFEEGLRQAIDWSEFENSGSEAPAVNVHVDLDVQIDRSVRELKDRLEAGDELTDHEVRVLLTRGDEIGLKPDELHNLLADE